MFILHHRNLLERLSRQVWTWIKINRILMIKSRKKRMSRQLISNHQLRSDFSIKLTLVPFIPFFVFWSKWPKTKKIYYCDTWAIIWQLTWHCLLICGFFHVFTSSCHHKIVQTSKQKQFSDHVAQIIENCQKIRKQFHVK